jgi:argininosuccinate synthase
MKKEKVVLAYSGGLDTSVILTWLIRDMNYDVIACYLDAGQTEDKKGIRKKAAAAGAISYHAIDIKKEFVERVIFQVVKANAVYENDYLLGTSMARPVMAEKLVELAHKTGAKYICHGATGKGNDQVRFEATIYALDPSLKIIAPWRFWDFKSRDDLINYAKKQGIKIDQTKKKIYSRDENLWHISHEGGNLEDPWNEYKDDIHVLSKPAEKAPDKPEFVEIGFKKGVPKSLNGKTLGGVSLIEKLNALGSKHGVGTVDIVENRLVGMKSRGIYETPGGTILMEAHKHLEKLVLDRDTINLKNQIAIKYADLLYDGKYFVPLREAIDAFVDKTQETVTGTVKMKLYKGLAKSVATKSPNSLYSEKFATFDEDDVYDQKDADGFIKLFSLSMKIRAILNKDKK